jgi:hypothetical protein
MSQTVYGTMGRGSIHQIKNNPLVAQKDMVKN